MNLKLVEKIADAVLYEGYILYPYRASAVKNRQRFNFGALMPESYSIAQRGTANWSMQTECLVLGDADTMIEVKARFLHLLMREVWQPLHNLATEHSVLSQAGNEALSTLLDANFQPVEALEIEGQFWQTWQEAVEREADTKAIKLGELVNHPQSIAFSFPARQEAEYLYDSEGNIPGVLVRKQEAVEGVIEMRSTMFVDWGCGLQVESVASGQLGDDNLQSAIHYPHLYKLTVRILNRTELAGAAQKSRDEALLFSLASTHTILGVQGGEFVSLLEPPEECSKAVAACNQIGTFPVLVGEVGERDLLLSSPIILYDYPQIAPESAGDLFDGAEIDEILMLRIMTLTDEEKREMRSVDERARQILERTETMPVEQLMKLHGVMRSIR
jgi:hypothetical protein